MMNLFCAFSLVQMMEFECRWMRDLIAVDDTQFKENEAGEAQSIELRKMDPAAIYRMVTSTT